MNNSKLPTEVELVYEVMPCNAMRTVQEPLPQKHSCAYFRQWGTYHSFDYIIDGIPDTDEIPVDVAYVGRSYLVPEILSGCRKAPIMAVGINPNLPGWFKNKKGALNPLFDNYKQYAHYFRYRSTAKLIIPQAAYLQMGGGDNDTPFSDFTLNIPPDANGKRIVKAAFDNQTMYQGYRGLLTSLATTMGWTNHKLSLNEDFSYMNMVACPSAKWRTVPDPDDAQLPPMTVNQRDGIIAECFHERKHFIRQLFQSLPKVLIVFSQATANAFIGEMRGNFIQGNPQPGERIEQLLERHIRLKYGQLPDGTELTARVIFSPHISGTPDQFNLLRAKVLAQLVQEAQAGGLSYNADTGHLHRPQGDCSFCPMLEIGSCDYEQELTKLSSGPVFAKKSSIMEVEKEKQLQNTLINDFIANTNTEFSKEKFWTDEEH